MIERVVRWYDDPADADRDDAEHYQNMTPQQRLDEMVELLNTWGRWHERRLERVARFIELPRG